MGGAIWPTSLAVVNTLFQGPKSLGRSRHGAPVRLHHSTVYEVAIVPPGPPRALHHAQRCFDLLPLPLIQLQANNRGRPWSTPSPPWKARCFWAPQKVCDRSPAARSARLAGCGARGPGPRHEPRPNKQTGPTTPYGPSGTGTGTFTGTRGRFNSGTLPREPWLGSLRSTRPHRAPRP